MLKKSSIIIAIDTSGDSLGLCVYNIEKEEFFTFNELSIRSQSDILHVKLKELITQANVSFSDVCAIVVCTGPGSYTGMRVGIAAAKGLSFAIEQITGNPVTIAGVSAFEVFAQTFNDKLITMWINAGINEVYVQSAQSGELVGAPVIKTIKEAASELVEGNICGNGASKYRDEIARSVNILEKQTVDAKTVNCIILAKIGYKHIQNGTFKKAEPIYLKALSYKKQAELNG